VPVAGGGSCFRISLARARRLEMSPGQGERSGQQVV
jgi:hypothetical protein